MQEQAIDYTHASSEVSSITYASAADIAYLI